MVGRNTAMRLAGLGMASALALGAADVAHAATVAPTTTYSFSGTCTDCRGIAGAELTLSNYTLGTPISAANFVSFHYDGTNRMEEYTVAAAQNPVVSGAITGPLPDAETFALTLVFGEFGYLYFNSEKSTGDWSTGFDVEELDYGSTHVWAGAAPVATVPEPISAAIVGAGLLGTSLLRRRRDTSRG